MTEASTSPLGAIASGPGHDVAIYEWCAWESFLGQLLLPAAMHIQGAVEDTAADVLAQLHADCRTFLFQINLSLSEKFPSERKELVAGLLARGIRVLNRGVEDIRKSSLHRLLAKAGLPSAATTEDGPADEVLIVKTDCNYGGRYERILTQVQRRRLEIPDAEIGLSGWDDYRVLPRSEMPPEWWCDPTLVVERFIENPEGRFFRVVVAGESVMVVEAYHEAMIKKVGGGSRDRNFFIDRARLSQLTGNPYLSGDLLILIDRFLAASGLDFGSLDIVHKNEEFYIVDLNTTPYGSRDGLKDDVAEFLRSGIRRVPF
jgi:hypothetical protein